PGGGGYGDPFRREPQAVLTDVRNGWVSADAARAEYGVVLIDMGDDYQIDEAATEGLRSTDRG
ncbi:MAG TPA: hypothetical protein VKB09_02090, partial [Thermomicrobiales bacterium]|nr:hypothetical protein [Thermomicrobiales bacterium]